MKRVIPVNTAESAYQPTVDPSASVGPAIMRVPIVRKVGCFTSGSFVVYDRCCCVPFPETDGQICPSCLPSVSILNLFSSLCAKIMIIATNEKFIAISGISWI